VSCRNYAPDASIHYDFVDVDDKYCINSGPKPTSSVQCTQPESTCWGSEWMSTDGLKNGRCDEEAHTCVCRPTWGGPTCIIKEQLISNVVTSGAVFGTAGIPLGQSLTITWSSDVHLTPYVSILLTRVDSAAFPVAVYLASHITNVGSYTWAVGINSNPSLEPGSGYIIRVQADGISSLPSVAFSIADACSYMSCGTHGQCSAGQCQCKDGYSGSLCEISPCVAAGCIGTSSTCINSDFAFGTSMHLCPCSSGQCPCIGAWSGIGCQTCGLTCSNRGTPSTDCRTCNCPVGSWGNACQYEYFDLAFRLNIDASAWLLQNGTATNSIAAARFNQTLRMDIITALHTVTSVPTEVFVSTLSSNNAKVTAIVRLSVQSIAPTSPASSPTRRLLTVSDVTSVYYSFLPLFGDQNSLLFQGEVTAKYDPTWAVTATDPTGTAALAQANPPMDCFNQICSTNAASNSDSNGNKSIVDIIKGNTLYLALVIVGFVTLAACIGAALFFGVRHFAKGSGSDLKRLQSEGTNGQEFTTNPARTQWNQI
jgi:hypothetical protein